MVRNSTAGFLGVLTGCLLGVLLFRAEHTHTVRIVGKRGGVAGLASLDETTPPPGAEQPGNAAAAPAPFDLDSKVGLRDAIASVASGDDSELVLLTSDGKGIRAAVNMALQLRRINIRHHLVLMGHRSDCERAQRGWPWLNCGWSHGLVGFDRYQYGTSMTAAGVRLWALWSAKWLILARLIELRVNVLALDTDMLLLADPYPTLQSEPLSSYTLILPAEGTRVNLGAMYVRGSRCAHHGGTASVFWDVVRRLRLFVEQAAAQCDD